MDRISNLSQDITEKILTLMPIQDALRTNILSKKWRYCWTTMPKLEFSVITSPSNSNIKRSNKHKYTENMFHVLLLHKGPILEFRLHLIYGKKVVDEIDPIIVYLSRNNNIKKFHFEKQSVHCYYKLPSSFFSFQGLEHLVLVGCVIKPPLNFNGLSMIRRLIFRNCDITAKMLQRLHTNCALIQALTLEECNGSFDVEENKCTYVELFKCLPCVQILQIFNLDIENFAQGGMQQKLPTPLVYLRIIDFDVCLQHDDLLFVLSVISNSPNLEQITLEIHPERCARCAQQEVNNLFDFEDYSDLNLDKLKQLEIRNFQNVAREIGFVKLIMAKSPVLKKAQMQLSIDVSVDEELKMLRDLVHLPFPRASPTAKFIIER